MTAIKASCPDCGPVTLEPDLIVARLCIDTAAWSYCFPCPTCRLRVAKPCDHRTAKLLESSGVLTEPWELPLELFELHDGPPITLDDVHNFIIDLETGADR